MFDHIKNLNTKNIYLSWKMATISAINMPMTWDTPLTHRKIKENNDRAIYKLQLRVNLIGR